MELLGCCGDVFGCIAGCSCCCCCVGVVGVLWACVEVWWGVVVDVLLRVWWGLLGVVGGGVVGLVVGVLLGCCGDVVVQVVGVRLRCC